LRGLEDAHFNEEEHFSGASRQLGDVAVLLDGERPGPGQVRDAESLVQAQGREGHAEVRDGAQTAPTHRQDPRGVPPGLEAQGDAHPSALGGALLHRQTGSQGWKRKGRRPGRHGRLLFPQGGTH